MFGFFKRKKKHDSQQEPQDAQEQPVLLDEPEGAPDKEPAADVSAPSEPLAEEPPKPAPERENEPTEVLAQEQSPEPVSKEDVSDWIKHMRFLICATSDSRACLQSTANLAVRCRNVSFA